MEVRGEPWGRIQGYIFKVKWSENVSIFACLLVCLFSEDTEKEECVIRWLERWRGSGRSCGDKSMIRIYCVKHNIFSIKKARHGKN